MDPATIVGLVSSAVTLATVCGSAANDLKTLLSRYKNAKLAILSMVQGLDTMQLAWSRIGQWAENQTPDGLLEEDDFKERLRRSLETGSLVMDALREELLIYKPSKMGLTKRSKLVWNEGTLRSHQERIRDQASSMTLLLQAVHLPTLRDRNDLLRESEKQFKMSDESAYSIVPSRVSMSIYTRHTTDSGASKSEENLVYKPLTFENELFTARVYKRNYRTPAVQRFLKGIEQKTSGKTSPRNVAQEVVEDHFGSEADVLTMVGPGLTQRRPTKAQSGTSIPSEGQLAGDDGTSEKVDTAPNTGPSILSAEARNQEVRIIESFVALRPPVHRPVLLDIPPYSSLSLCHSPMPMEGQPAGSGDTNGKFNMGPYAKPRISFGEACEQGNVEIVETYLKSGQDVHVPVAGADHGLLDLSAIHVAAEGGHVRVVEILLSYGADRDMLSRVSWKRPLHLAVQAGHVTMVQYLLDNGTDIAAPGENSVQAIHVAAKNGSTGIVVILLNRGAAIESSTLDGARPLHVASQNPRRVNVIKLLCSEGADIEAETHAGYTPLYRACLHNAVDNMKALLEFGTANSPKGPSVLDLALRCGFIRAARLLLERGLDPNRPVFDRATALHRLFTIGISGCDTSDLVKYVASVDLLLEHGADVNLQDSSGNTALHHLCTRSPFYKGFQIELANRLLRKMKAVDTVNSAGRTALGVYVDNGHIDQLITTLINSGSRLLLRKPHIELGLNLHQPSGGDRFSSGDPFSDAYLLYHLDCYARTGSDSSIKRLGDFHEFFTDDLSEAKRRMDILRRWLQDAEWDRWI